MERGKFKSDCLVADIDIKNDYKLHSQIRSGIGINENHDVNWLYTSKNRRKVINHYLKTILRGHIWGTRGGYVLLTPI